MKLEKTYALHVQKDVARHWVIVGAGGTGGYFIPNMMRQLAIQNKRLELAGRPVHKVTIIDADEVEDKNLTRQNFVRQDVGRNKAEVMATRYGRSFGVEISYIPEYITSSKQLQEIVAQSKLSPVFIDCVDNNKTRVLIYKAYLKFRQGFYISSGNEEWGGQVVCGFNYDGVKPNNAYNGPHLFHLPCVMDLYPEVMEAKDKLPTELSCGERAVSAPQNIYTNMTAANIIMGYVNTILTADADQKEGLKFHSVAFNAQTFSTTTRLNTLSNLDIELVGEPKEEVAEPVKVEVAVVKEEEAVEVEA